MVNTPPYQHRGKCGHYMPQFDSHLSCFGCRAKAKGQDPCAQGADATQCAACASLTQEQWSQLRENFSKRAAQHEVHDEIEDTNTPEFTGELSGEDIPPIDDSLLDMDPLDFSSASALPLGISPLHSQPPASTPDIPADLPAPVQQIASSTSVDPSALFRAPAPPSDLRQ